MRTSKSICIFTLFFSGCAQMQERADYLHGPRSSVSDYQDIGTLSAKSETKALESFSQRAGLLRLPASQDKEWQLVVRAGLNVIDEQCEKYVDAIFWVDRDLRTANSQINLVGATTATLLGVFDASSRAIATTAAAFGFGSQAITNYSSGILYKINPSGIRKLVERSRAAYRQGVEDQIATYTSRPSTVAAIQGYLSLCLPASIETQINEAVAASDFQLIKTDNGTLNPVPKIKRIATEQVIQENIINDVRKGLEKEFSKPLRPAPRVSFDQRPKGCLENQYECLLSRSAVVQIKRALCINDPTSDFDDKTREAIGAFEASKSEHVVALNRRLEAKEGFMLLGTGPCTLPFRNALERFRYGDKGTNYARPSSATVRILVDTLEHGKVVFAEPKPITFDKTLRNAIAQFQQRNGLSPSGEVTKELLDKLPKD